MTFTALFIVTDSSKYQFWYHLYCYDIMSLLYRLAFTSK